MALILSKEFDKQGYNVPTKVAPKFLLSLASFFDKSISEILPDIGNTTLLDTTRMKEVLKIEPRDLKESLVDMAYSMIENGFVKKSNKYHRYKNSDSSSRKENNEQQKY